MLRFLLLVSGIVWALKPQSVENHFTQISLGELRDFQSKTQLGYSGYLSGHFLHINSQKDFLVLALKIMNENSRLLLQI